LSVYLTGTKLYEILDACYFWPLLDPPLGEFGYDIHPVLWMMPCFLESDQLLVSDGAFADYALRVESLPSVCKAYNEASATDVTSQTLTSQQQPNNDVIVLPLLLQRCRQQWLIIAQTESAEGARLAVGLALVDNGSTSTDETLFR